MNNIRSISVVIPAFNSQEWILQTLTAVSEAAKNSTLAIDIVLVDDGSSDQTPKLGRDFASLDNLAMKVISQENQGRFMAIWNGVKAASGDWILLLNSRQTLSENIFKVLEEKSREKPQVKAWCSHVDTSPSAPLLGHFWSVPTAIFWGKYWKNLKQTKITLDNFDQVPKGTGGLFIDKELFMKACMEVWPEGNLKLVSDDTKLLRDIAKDSPIYLDPDLRSVYHPRVKWLAFLGHAFGRGTMFIDSYAGGSKLRNVILLSLVTLPIIYTAAAVYLLPILGVSVIVIGLALFSILVSGMSLVALGNHASKKAAVSFLVFSIPFTVVFWSGLARGLFVHWKAFSRKA
jgi:hypothetical protein